MMRSAAGVVEVKNWATAAVTGLGQLGGPDEMPTSDDLERPRAPMQNRSNLVPYRCRQKTVVLSDSQETYELTTHSHEYERVGLPIDRNGPSSKVANLKQR